MVNAMPKTFYFLIWVSPLFSFKLYIPSLRPHARERKKKAMAQGQEKELIIVTLQWEAKIPKGQAPPGRGYHVALLHDARIFISGGYNGVSVFDDLWALDLSAAAYLPQVVCPFLISFSSCIVLNPFPSLFHLRFATFHHHSKVDFRRES